jgi:hypothetical protein
MLPKAEKACFAIADVSGYTGGAKILLSYTFEERGDGGTRFEFRVATPKPKDLPFYERVRPTIEANFTAGFDILRTMVAERRAASSVEDEPPLPVSHERFLTQPHQTR